MPACTRGPAPHTPILEYTHLENQDRQNVEHYDDRCNDKYEVGQLRGQQTSACLQSNPVRGEHSQAHLCTWVHSIPVEVEDAVQQQRCGQYHNFRDVNSYAARLCSCSSRRHLVSCCRQRRQQRDCERPPGLCARSRAGGLRPRRPGRTVCTRCGERREGPATALILNTGVSVKQRARQGAAVRAQRRAGAADRAKPAGQLRSFVLGTTRMPASCWQPVTRRRDSLSWPISCTKPPSPSPGPRFQHLKPCAVVCCSPFCPWSLTSPLILEGIDYWLPAWTTNWRMPLLGSTTAGGATKCALRNTGAVAHPAAPTVLTLVAPRRAGGWR